MSKVVTFKISGEQTSTTMDEQELAIFKTMVASKPELELVSVRSLKIRRRSAR